MYEISSFYKTEILTFVVWLYARFHELAVSKNQEKRGWNYTGIMK